MFFLCIVIAWHLLQTERLAIISGLPEYVAIKQEVWNDL